MTEETGKPNAAAIRLMFTKHTFCSPRSIAPT
jgi:hypothetical protein